MILLSDCKPLMVCLLGPKHQFCSHKDMLPWLGGLEKAAMEGELKTQVAPEEGWGNVRVGKVLQSQKVEHSSGNYTVQRKIKMIFSCFLFSQSICPLGGKG